MFREDMLFEWYCFIIKSRSIETADETSVFKDQLFLLLFTPQVCKRINNDTENEIQDYDDDYEEEQQIIYNSCDVQRFL